MAGDAGPWEADAGELLQAHPGLQCVYIFKK